jgi:hypothetical protein
MTARRLLVILFGAVIALVTACGGASHPARSHPASKSPAQAKPGSGNSIPQGGGGDHDGDNSGGPSDGDGNV